MTAGSNVNPNYPIPGIDQSSRGFRDNFSTIKKEISDLQSKQIIFTGALAGTQSTIFDSGPDPIVIPGVINAANLHIADNVPGAVIYLAADGNFAAAYDLFNYNSITSTVQIRGSDINPILTFTTTLTDAVVASTGNIAIAVGSTPAIYVSDAGAVGINNAAPSVQLDVASNTYVPAQFHSSQDLSDNAVRFTTDQMSATMGLVLEQRAADAVAGIRIGTNGTLSLHTGEPMDAGLSDTSRRLVILPGGEVGINNNNPSHALDVIGTVSIAGALLVASSINLRPMAEPIQPTAGFVLYTDQADGKLKAKSSSGTVTPLANP